MEKNYYLSREEQKIWEFIKDKDIIQKSMLKDIFPTYKNNKLNRIMSSLNKKKYAKRILKDNYLVMENINDYHKIALMIYPGYIGLSSALRKYNLLDYEDFTIYIITFNKSKTINLENYTFKYISMREKSIGFAEKDGLKISSLEKTFFDLFYLNRYASFDITTKAIYDSKNIDWNNFLSYFKKFGTPLLCQKTGYILDMLKNETKKQIPDFVIDYFKSKIKIKAKLINKKLPSKFIKEWLIQDNLGKEKILSWWY